MTAPRGWGLPESHLLPDVVVAFVDGELSLGPRERAAAHIARCPGCAAEVTAQRQAVAAVKRAGAPSMSAGFLASLRSIPEHTDLPSAPDNLAVTAEGQLVAIQRPDRVAGLRERGVFGGTPLGSTAPLGQSPNVLGSGRSSRKKAAQGAGVVVSGLVLSALALVGTSADSGEGATDPATLPQPNANLLPAQLAVPKPVRPVAPAPLQPPTVIPVSDTSAIAAVPAR
ncbi:zf-HC2 domain-containing protein [Amycolatopsis sp. PS_44_ISF1]|uniref:anti-sigma factor family protein n=1 Tax=Amycolatopsis sp. PS_44_ISF1 TaxID=2974917 RepID=UPI0028DF371B|nr:zf-HC2 domain-containing protein [Amycolatopsis sp. PS_44_ISF1]MDT8909423.1 zf-HC2 domain-containing protein [Amycolatopsis sp. PS_44_ISF1]